MPKQGYAIILSFKYEHWSCRVSTVTVSITYCPYRSFYDSHEKTQFPSKLNAGNKYKKKCYLTFLYFSISWKTYIFLTICLTTNMSSELNKLS